MKKLILFSFLLTSATISAQTDPYSVQVFTKLTAFYNTDQFSEIHNLLSENFKQKETEQNTIDFYQHNLKDRSGKIISWKYLGMMKDEAVYSVNFEKTKLSMKLRLDLDQRISSILWTSEKMVLNLREPGSIKTNNPRKIQLEKYVDSLAMDYLKGSLYEIASISKTFTAIMLAHAVNEGRIKLNDDIRKYLPGKYPDLQFEGIPIKIINLCNHTSGLPSLPDDFEQQTGYDPSNPYLHYSKENIYTFLHKFRPDTIPGARSSYSNFGFAVLGTVLENVYKMPLAKLIQQIITGPFKMNATHYELSAEEKKMLVTGYTDETGEAVTHWDFEAFKAAGGLKSNIHDMLLYLKANLGTVNQDIS